jgi:predicted lipid-binding transport protein (Tim44 family)
VPAYARNAKQPAKAKGSGGGGKLAAGGVVGLLVGGLIGGLTALIVAVKSIKKLVGAPLKLLK